MSFNGGTLLARADNVGSYRLINMATNRTPTNVAALDATERIAKSCSLKRDTGEANTRSNIPTSAAKRAESIGNESDSEESCRLSNEPPKKALGELSAGMPGGELNQIASNRRASTRKDESNEPSSETSQMKSFEAGDPVCIDSVERAMWWLSNRTETDNNQSSNHRRSMGKPNIRISIKSKRSGVFKTTGLSGEPCEAFSSESWPERSSNESKLGKPTSSPPEFDGSCKSRFFGCTLFAEPTSKPAASQTQNARNAQTKPCSLSTNHFDLILIIRFLLLLLATTQHFQHVHGQQNGVFPSNQFK